MYEYLKTKEIITDKALRIVWETMVLSVDSRIGQIVRFDFTHTNAGVLRTYVHIQEFKPFLNGGKSDNAWLRTLL